MKYSELINDNDMRRDEHGFVRVSFVTQRKIGMSARHIRIKRLNLAESRLWKIFLERFERLFSIQTG